MKRPLIPGAMSHTAAQLAEARARGHTANGKTWDPFSVNRPIQPLRDFATDKPEPEPRDADGRFCPRRGK